MQGAMAFVIGHVVLALSAASPSDGDGIMWSRFYVNLRAAVPGVSVMDHTGGAPTLRWGYATLTSHAPNCMSDSITVMLLIYHSRAHSAGRMIQQEANLNHSLVMCRQHYLSSSSHPARFNLILSASELAQGHDMCLVSFPWLAARGMCTRGVIHDAHTHSINSVSRSSFATLF